MGFSLLRPGWGLHRRFPQAAAVFRALTMVPLWMFAARVAVGRLFSRFTLRHRMGLKLLLDRESPVDQRILYAGGYELAQQAMLFGFLRRLNGPHHFVDVGAYWGLYSLIAARSGQFASVTAFEPDPQNLARARVQAMLNGQTIDLRAVAICEQPGTEHFIRSDAHGNSAGVSLFRSSHHPTSGDGYATSEVQTDTLDRQISLRDTILFIKIDVEGFELAVLEGAGEVLRRNSVVLQVECFARNRPALRRLLIELGYSEIGAVESDLYFTNIG